MDQKNIGRRIQIAIEAPSIGDYRFAVPVVARVLRLMADGIEAHENSNYGRNPPPPELQGWGDAQGQKTLDLTPPPFFDDAAPGSDSTNGAYKGVTVSWIVEHDGDSEPEDPNLGRDTAFHNPTDEELASLTDAERAARQWTLTRDDFFWHLRAPDNSVHASIPKGSEPGQAETMDDAISAMVAHLRLAGHIGENEKISVNFGEIQ